jgi:hypothetical protein
MTALVLAELRRVTTRRLIRVTVLLAVVGIAIGGIAAFARSGSISEAEYQQRVIEAKDREAAQDAQIVACLEANGVTPGDDVSDEIAQLCFPAEEPAGVDDPRFPRRRLEDVLHGVIGVLAVVGWALGASLVGAEFASRGMTTLLTWEPRRGRVFAAKLVATLVAMAVFAVAVLALLALAMWPALAFHGAPLGPDDPSLWSLAGTIGRGVGLTALAAGIGFALATIGRNTAVALGAGFAYVIVLENILGTAVEDWRRWLLLGNVIVLVSGQEGTEVPGRSVAGAAVFLTAVAATALVAAAATFRTRDLS